MPPVIFVSAGSSYIEFKNMFKTDEAKFLHIPFEMEEFDIHIRKSLRASYGKNFLQDLNKFETELYD